MFYITKKFYWAVITDNLKYKKGRKNLIKDSLSQQLNIIAVMFTYGSSSYRDMCMDIFSYISVYISACIYIHLVCIQIRYMYMCIFIWVCVCTVDTHMHIFIWSYLYFRKLRLAPNIERFSGTHLDYRRLIKYYCDLGEKGGLKVRWWKWGWRKDNHRYVGTPWWCQRVEQQTRRR